MLYSKKCWYKRLPGTADKKVICSKSNGEHVHVGYAMQLESDKKLSPTYPRDKWCIVPKERGGRAGKCPTAVGGLSRDCESRRPGAGSIGRRRRSPAGH